MPHYVALLRGINLGKRRIKMPALVQLFEEQGFSDVSTILASGNVVFSSTARSGAKLAAAISSHLAAGLGYEVPTRIRSASELRAAIAAAPCEELFSNQPDASTQVTFFDQPLAAELATDLEGRSTKTDRLSVVGRELYWRCATKLSESPLWKNSRLNPHNLPKGTTRNLQTLAKIADRLPA